MRRVAGLGAAALVVALGAPGAPAQEGSQVPLLAMTVNGSGHQEVYVSRADGTGRRRLTQTPSAFSAGGSSSPAWSPDGRTLAFQSVRDAQGHSEGTSQIYAVNLDGTGDRRVTNGTADAAPAWSPDGARLAFVAFVRSRPRASIAVVNADGTGRRSLTTGAYDTTPAWSPDGTRIVFTRALLSPTGSSFGLWVMNADGTGQRSLGVDGHDPSWSPDGTRIAFASDRDRFGETCFQNCSFNDELYVMRADGTQQRRLTRSTAIETSPAWSPDGTRIAFHSDRNYPVGRSPEIYLMNLDGGCVTRVSNTSSSSSDPEWQPGTGAAPPGPCGADAPGAVVPIVEADLAPARREPGPIFFIGTSFRNMLLSHAETNSLIYDDCALPAPRGCFGEVQLHTSSICTSHPLTFGGGPDFLGDPIVPRYSWRRGALLARYPDEGQTDVHTGSQTVDVFAWPVTPVIDALQPVAGPRVDQLAPPAFGASVLRLVHETMSAYRRLRSVPAVQRALHLTRERVLQRLALGRALRGHRLGPPTRC